MNARNIMSVIFGLVLSLIVSGVVYYFLFLEVFDLFGTDELTDPETRDGKIFYTALILTLFTMAITFFLVKVKRKYLAIGFGLPASIGLTLLIFVGPTYLNKSSYYEEFDKKKW